MGKIKNRFLAAIVIGIVAVMYSILVFVIKDMDNAGGNFWGGYLFTMLAFGITAAVMCSFKITQTKTAPVQMPLILGTFAYLGIVLVVNLIFICLDKDTKATAMIIINVLLLLAYIIFFVVVYMFTRHMDQTSKKIVDIRETANEMEINVSSLVYMAKDESVKQALTELKNKVHYGERISPSSRPSVQSAHQAVVTQIEVIRTLLASGADEQTLLSSIQQARNLLSTRDEMIRAFGY